MERHTRKIVVFPADPISAYYEKGEIKERYFNPCDFFGEVHVISPCDRDVEPDGVKTIAGNAVLRIHPVGYLSVSTLFHIRSGIRKLLATRRRVIRIVASIRPDAIRAFDPLMQGMLAVCCGNRLRIPVVVSLHGDYDEERLFRRKQLGVRRSLEFSFGSKLTEAYCLRRADAIVAVTRFVASYARRHGAKRIRVIYNRVNMSRFAPSRIQRDNERFTILSVGRQNTQKNQACLLEAVRNIDADLILIGNGELHNDLVAAARKLHVDSRVKFVKAVSHSKIHEYYSMSDAFAISSHFEGFCIPILEAMACSLPVVASDIPPIRELVEDAGILVPIKPEAFENAFQMLMANPEFRSSLGKRARQRAQLYDGRVMEEAEANLYKELIGEQGNVLSSLVDQFQYLEKGPARHLHRIRMSFLTTKVGQLRKGKKRFRILDLGCGDGVVAGYVKGTIQADDNMLCFDISPERLRRAKKNCSGVDAVAGDVRILPITDGSFDLVILHHVIEHVDGDLALLRECRRVIADEGTLLVGVPNEGGIIGSLTRRFHRKEYETSEHVNFYSRESMKAMMQASGFTKVTVSLFGFMFPFLPFHYWILRNQPFFWMGNKLTQLLGFTADSLLFTGRKTPLD